MKPSDGKIAIFICGPVRYVTYVCRMIDRVFQGYEYDCFYHLWKADLGNKVRGGEVSDLEEIEKHPRTKVLIRQEPYCVEDFAKAIGTESGSNSSINALMGMFFSVNLLCHYLEQLPDFATYRYILRLRTDCAIFHPEFPSLLDESKGTLTVSKSCFTRVTELCDHICFGQVEDFFSLWRFANMQEIYKAYQEGERNPDLTLLRRIQKNPGIRIGGNIVRFRDYHIVYFPTRDCDPKTISDAINQHGLEEFFRHSRRDLDFEAIRRFVAEWELKWQPEKKWEAKPDILLQKQTSSANNKMEMAENSLFQNLVHDVYFELSNLCNYADIHKKCPVHTMQKSHRILPSSIVFHVLEVLRKRRFCGRIGFHTYNEPLIDPRLFCFVAAARDACPESTIFLCTNGYYLNQMLAEELVGVGVTWIHVSAYSEEEYNRLIQIRVPILYQVERMKLDDRVNFYEGAVLDLKRSCYAPYHQIIITAGAKIGLCCLDWRRQHCFGDLTKQTFEEALRDSYLQEVYHQLSRGDRRLDLCRRCSWPGIGNDQQNIKRESEDNRRFSFDVCTRKLEVEKL